MAIESREKMANYLSYPQIAERLNIPLRTLYLYKQLGTAPATVKIGRHYRVSEEALAEWLQSNTQ